MHAQKGRQELMMGSENACQEEAFHLYRKCFKSLATRSKAADVKYIFGLGSKDNFFFWKKNNFKNAGNKNKDIPIYFNP